MLAQRCDICNIGVNTPEQLRNHERGKNHLKRVKQLQLQESNVQSGLAPPSCLASPSGSRVAAAAPSLWCDLCRMACESPQLLEVHRAGLLHQQKLRQASAGPSEEQARRGLEQLTLALPSNRCSLCDVECNTREQLRAHEAGSQHMRRLALSNPSAGPAPGDHYKVEIVGGSPQFRCLVCDVFCNTKEQLEIHQRGAPHMKRVRQGGGTPVLPPAPPPADNGFDRRPGGPVRSSLIMLAASPGAHPPADYMCRKCNEWLGDTKAVQSHRCAPRLLEAPAMVGDWPRAPSPPSARSEAGSLGTTSSGSTHLPRAPSLTLSETLSSTSLSPAPAVAPSPHPFEVSVPQVSATPAFDAALRQGVVARTEDEHEILCRLCSLTCNTPAAMEAHLSGGKHKKRQTRFGWSLFPAGTPPESAQPTVSLGDDQEFVVSCGGGMYECRVCNLKFNANNMESHVAGKQHAEKLVKALRAPPHPVYRPPLTRTVHLDHWRGEDANVKTKLTPRGYQWELFVKAMATDAVVYLPTGTGKTLVSALLLGEMLQRNPNYQAVFLVEKTLLVLQQGDFLRQQLSDVELDRFCWGSKTVERRRLRIASLCGDLADLGGAEKEPLWKQDIIVTTVGFYLNLLSKEVVRMEDICVIVIDEAHHCVKEHPFHRLLKEYHRPIPPNVRPKILGLTASPAGATTFDETLAQLRRLLSNLGGLHVLATEHSIRELEMYMSSSVINCVTVPMQSTEQDLQKHLVSFAVNLLAIVLPGSHHIASLRKELESASPNWPVIPKVIEQQITTASSKDSFASDVARNCLNGYYKLEAGGWELASGDVEEINQLAPHIEQCYPTMKRSLQLVQSSMKANLVSNASGVNLSPMMSSLVRLVEKGLARYSIHDQLVIVLTSQRSVARSVTDYLQTHINQADDEQKVSIACLVGHGTTSGSKQKAELGDRAELTKGMTVQQQRKALDEIKDMRHNVIVATSVAEEGVDLPACGLVILLSPPNTLTAIVQMRGRARLRESKFVVLCREAEQEKKFMSLLEREKNMFMAVKEVCREQAQPYCES